MADLKTLSDEMAKIKNQIEKLFCITGYRECDDLSGMDNYKQIKSADERQQLEEYRNILHKLDEVQSALAYTRQMSVHPACSHEGSLLCCVPVRHTRHPF